MDSFGGEMRPKRSADEAEGDFDDKEDGNLPTGRKNHMDKAGHSTRGVIAGVRRDGSAL
jgi:hypothetical protein